MCECECIYTQHCPNPERRVPEIIPIQRLANYVSSSLDLVDNIFFLSFSEQSTECLTSSSKFCRLRSNHYNLCPHTVHINSAVPARLGLKAPALAWPEAASAFSNPRPGQSRETCPKRSSVQLNSRWPCCIHSHIKEHTAFGVHTFEGYPRTKPKARRAMGINEKDDYRQP